MRIVLFGFIYDESYFNLDKNEWYIRKRIIKKIFVKSFYLFIEFKWEIKID